MPSLASQLGVTHNGIAAMPPQSQRDRIIEAIRTRIAAGVYPAGELIPSESRLATEFGVSAQPVKAALSNLKFTGEIVSRQGKGYFVAPLPSDTD